MKQKVAHFFLFFLVLSFLFGPLLSFFLGFANPNLHEVVIWELFVNFLEFLLFLLLVQRLPYILVFLVFDTLLVVNFLLFSFFFLQLVFHNFAFQDLVSLILLLDYCVRHAVHRLLNPLFPFRPFIRPLLLLLFKGFVILVHEFILHVSSFLFLLNLLNLIYFILWDNLLSLLPLISLLLNQVLLLIFNALLQILHKFNFVFPLLL